MKKCFLQIGFLLVFVSCAQFNMNGDDGGDGVITGTTLFSMDELDGTFDNFFGGDPDGNIQVVKESDFETKGLVSFSLASVDPTLTQRGSFKAVLRLQILNSQVSEGIDFLDASVFHVQFNALNGNTQIKKLNNDNSSDPNQKDVVFQISASDVEFGGQMVADEQQITAWVKNDLSGGSTLSQFAIELRNSTFSGERVEMNLGNGIPQGNKSGQNVTFVPKLEISY